VPAEAEARAQKGIAPVPWLFALYLFVVSGAALVVGAHDAALSHANLSVTALGALLLGLGMVFFAAACTLVALGRRKSWSGLSRPPCNRLVVVALLFALFVGIYVFFAGLRGAGGQRLVVVVVALALIAGAAAGLWYFGGDVDVTAARIGAVVLALVGTIVGVAQFWYQNQYLPTRAGRAVELSVGLERIGRQGSNDIVRATINFEDVGGRSVAVIGSVYGLTGSRVVRCHRPAKVQVVRPYFRKFLADPQEIRFTGNVREERPATVLAAGKFVGDGKRLDSGVASSRPFVFFVPRRFQLVRFRASLFAISTSVQLSQRRKPKYVSFTDDNDLYVFWHVDDDSWFHDLVIGRGRWVVIRYDLVKSRHKVKQTRVFQTLRVTARFPNPTWGEARPSHNAVERLFKQPAPSDASEPFADAELAGAPIATPTREEVKKKELGCE
jgi:hypothetical protein